jgi:transposase
MDVVGRANDARNGLLLLSLSTANTGWIMKKPPPSLTLSVAEGEALLARVHQSGLSAEDAGMVEQVIRLYFWVLFALQEAKLSLKRLRTLLFGKGAKATKPRAPEAASTSSEPRGEREEAGEWRSMDAEAAGGAEVASDAEPGASGTEALSKPTGGHRLGTGRLGAEAYAGAERGVCRHEALAVGQRCPVCGQGTFYELPPGGEMRIDGHALLSALRYELQKLRCSACGQICTATLPAEAGEEKYSARARAVLAIGRYYLGLPLSRLQGYQAMLGVPVPDATQWDQIEKVGDCSYGVFAYLERLAAQGELIYQDDTSVRMLSLIGENLTRRAQAEAMGFSRPKERTGMSTTAFVVKAGEQTICLYYSGRAHAGENLKALLLQRQANLSKPLVMSDALSHNEADETKLIRCHCLAHGRRQCSDLEDVFPQECAVVIEALKQVFDHDEQARDAQMSPEARFAYHQAYSRPIMDALQRWLDQQWADRLVEPNSSLGKAMASMQGHWETLTRFLEIAGAPIDNNLVERALKLFIRQRKNSLFYKTEHSASMASALTSLIATCLHAGVNALEYLVALQEHRAEVFAEPSAWLPWSYQARLAPPSATRRQSWAIWARSGFPFHSTMLSSRADRGPRVSAVLGHHVKRPCDKRFIHSQYPWPS